MENKPQDVAEKKELTQEELEAEDKKFQEEQKMLEKRMFDLSIQFMGIIYAELSKMSYEQRRDFLYKPVERVKLAKPMYEAMMALAQEHNLEIGELQEIFGTMKNAFIHTSEDFIKNGVFAILKKVLTKTFGCEDLMELHLNKADDILKETAREAVN